ncbi:MULTISPECIES: PadR family transcriptional regulator [Microbispora]|uniref:PadR family transcriptional regulator n=2 Tax=Microbispora TaxID=2005 RepID=A0A5J5JWQ5_9ACTN|nr:MULTISPECIES: helix-turn-helix transcriptional regulator [Microbispora]KAA9376033.1 PadR family transcriptional regulator [Microbispora cellulosiformans]GIH32939.1 PadR family transcriptional regulator [Microbispora amethystogenes]
MAPDPRITMTVARVLRAFLDDPAESRYGFELMQLTGLQSGTLYPILARLEEAEWLESQREDIDPHVLGRPARKLYRITRTGATLARQELALISERLRPPSGKFSQSLRPQGGQV